MNTIVNIQLISLLTASEAPSTTQPSKPVLKGAGPKIKTKDGNAVHLKELIKDREGKRTSNNLPGKFCCADFTSQKIENSAH